MKASVAVTAIGLLVIAVVSLGYLRYIAPIVPDVGAFIINILVVPFIFGWSAFFLLRGPIFFKAVLLLIVPILHVVVFGGDPAKPGLEYEVAAVEYVLMLLGLVVGVIVHKVASNEGGRN